MLPVWLTTNPPTCAPRPLNRANETAVLRSLSGVAGIALTRFSTTLEEDEALLAGAAGGASKQAGQPEGAQGRVQVQELSEEMRLAVLFRAERKRLLLGVMQALAARVQEVGAMADLKAAALAPSRKGEAPRASTTKGFGKR